MTSFTVASTVTNGSFSLMLSRGRGGRSSSGIIRDSAGSALSRTSRTGGVFGGGRGGVTPLELLCCITTLLEELQSLVGKLLAIQSLVLSLYSVTSCNSWWEW